MLTTYLNRLILLLILFTGFDVLADEKYDFIVAKDGSGDFKTVQEAFDAVPDFRKVPTIIFIKKGIYKEKLVLAGSKQLVIIKGDELNATILTYDDFSQKKNLFGEEKGTSGSASFYIYGDGFSAENITFENSSGPVGQAVAVLVVGDKVAFKNCRFLGFQDTLYTYGRGSRQYYKNCYIEGTVDFIFGSSTALFDDCDIYAKSSGYLTAASTPDTTKYGYVFLNCRVKGGAPVNSVFLGRPWRPYAKTVFINSELGNIIKAEGWDHWGKETNKESAFYAEYKNSGTGYQPDKRVSWSHQLTEQQTREYTLENILRGWVPFD